MTTCCACHAPHGELVTRRVQDPENKWSLDVDLADEWPEDWGPPHRVIVRRGRCETCGVPLGLPRTRKPRTPLYYHYPQDPKCQARRRHGNLCNLNALAGSDFCGYHQADAAIQEVKARKETQCSPSS